MNDRELCVPLALAGVGLIASVMFVVVMIGYAG